MSKYLILTDIENPICYAEWWDDQTVTKTTVEIEDDFESACKHMRNTISEITEECGFFPFEDGRFEPFSEYDYEDIAELDKIVSGVVSNPNYSYDNVEALNIENVDDADWGFAFVGNKDLVLVDYYGQRLKFNVHNMLDPKKNYFFKYCECDEDGNTICAISIRMICVDE